MPSKPKYEPDQPLRVKDKVTGHEYSIRAASLDDTHEVIDKPAVGPGGHLLPAKPNRTPARKTAASSQSTSESKAGSPADQSKE